MKDEAVRARYVEAFERSDFEAMLNYYKANFPRVSAVSDSSNATEAPSPPSSPDRKVQCPVLMIHGLDDPVFMPATLNDTWMWIERDFTLVTIPGASHFVQQDAPELVTDTMVSWLRREKGD